MHVKDATLRVDGTEYPGELTLPHESTDHGAVLLPGANHGPYGDVFDRLAETLAEHEISLLRFETWGDSRELPDLEEKEEVNLFAEFDAAVEFLQDCEYARISVIAKSFGGRIALRHVPEGVDELVLWAPAVFLEEGEVVEHIDAPDDVDLPLIETSTIENYSLPIDILQGDEDNIPVENARELAETVPHGDAHVIAGADHSFVGGQPEDDTIDTTLDLLTE